MECKNQIGIIASNNNENTVRNDNTWAIVSSHFNNKNNKNTVKIKVIHLQQSNKIENKNK